MNKDLIKEVIENSIQHIELQYNMIQGLILTEDDLKSVIFHRLSNCCSDLVRPKLTKDESITAPMLHTELSWYDREHKLTIKPDITILEPKRLSILHGIEEGIEFPSKQCSFGSNAILMELKFIKRKEGIITRDLIRPPKQSINNIWADVEKIKRLLLRLEDQGSHGDVFCYFIVFNKTNKKCSEFDDFMNTVNQEAPEKYKMIYSTGNVVFPSSEINNVS